MRRIIGVLLALAMAVPFAACGNGSAPPATGDGPFPGKIAIVSSAPTQNFEETYAGELMVEKYGADKILHYNWPSNFVEDSAGMVNIMAEIAADKDVKAVIVNQAVLGTIRAIDKLLETRKDIFIVFCYLSENVHDTAARVDLALSQDHIEEGPFIVRQAVSQGAKTFVHYSFPRHMSMFMLAGRRDMIRETCEELGITFLDVYTPDPMSNVGPDGARQFIYDDVLRIVEEYGPDTAFYSTNCGMQIPLIKSVMETGAIFTQPCCASPYHGFPEALGIDISNGYTDMERVIEETRQIAAANNMTGRLSTWPVPTSVLTTMVGTEYAIKWINEEVPDEEIDRDVLNALCVDAVKLLSGTDIHVELNYHKEHNVEYDNIYMLRMRHLVY